MKVDFDIDARQVNILHGNYDEKLFMKLCKEELEEMTDVFGYEIMNDTTKYKMQTYLDVLLRENWYKVEDEKERILQEHAEYQLFIQYGPLLQDPQVQAMLNQLIAQQEEQGQPAQIA